MQIVSPSVQSEANNRPLHWSIEAVSVPDGSNSGANKSIDVACPL